MEKPFSQACENNQQPIFDVIKNYFPAQTDILEVGSGTGQHAVFMGEQMPNWQWQTSDQESYHEGINAWLTDAKLANVSSPLVLDVTQSDWSIKDTSHIFSANTSHIMHWQMVEAFFAGVGKILKPGGYFCLYGPFNFNGQFTSDSNKQFNQYLRNQDPGMGIRNFEELDALAESANLLFVEKHPMPANNFILVWQKK